MRESYRHSWHGHRVTGVAILVALAATCADAGTSDRPPGPDDGPQAVADVEAAVWAFHRADTARDAEAIIGLLWPEFTMLVDGQRQTYGEAAAGSREFMGSLQLFHTDWTDLRVLPLSSEVAVSSFLFRDSIVTRAGQLIRSHGPTTMIWERRGGEWRLLFVDADHYPVDTGQNE